jgi:hypothetical protein
MKLYKALYGLIRPSTVLVKAFSGLLQRLAKAFLEPF